MVVDHTSEQLGVIPLQKALELAISMELDLVEISPNANPPVCKIMDFGKFKYREQKKAHETKMKQHQVHVKEVKLRPVTDEHDYQIKLRNAKRFLSHGDKVKFIVQFRGRELAHQEFGIKYLEKAVADLADDATIEQMPKIEGRSVTMVAIPKK